MDFELSEDEHMLKAVAERFVADRYSGDRRRGWLAEPAGFSADNWRLLGELGIIATAFSAEAGGLGIGPVARITLHEALGRGLLAEPLVECAVLAGGLFERTAPPALAARWLPDLVTGARRVALAHRELAARDCTGFVATRAESDGSGWRLDGSKALAIGAVGADALILSARRDGAPDARDGVELFLAPRGTMGVRLTPWRLIDGTLAARVDLDGAWLPGDARLEGGLDALREADEAADLARLAEAVGLMDLLLGATLEHLRTRRQFGQALGSFQAIQHRMVAQYVAVEQSRALLLRAALTNGSAESRREALAGARAFIAEASVALGHEAIQLHGGMGISDEMAITHAHKRLFLLSRHPVAAATALDRFAGLAA